MDKYTMHSNYCDSLKEIYRAKNHDYDDSFAKSIDDIGYVAAITRMGDKMQRAKALLLANDLRMVSDESVQDTLLDLANYALMTAVEFGIRKSEAESDQK